MTLNVKKIANTMSIFHIKLKGIHLTVKAEIMNIFSVHSADFKENWEFEVVSLIFL